MMYLNTKEKVLEMAAAYSVAEILLSKYPKLERAGYLDKAFNAMKAYKNGVPNKVLEKLLDLAAASLDATTKEIEAFAADLPKTDLLAQGVLLLQLVRASAMGIIPSISDDKVKSLLKSITLDSSAKTFSSSEIHNLIGQWIDKETEFIKVLAETIVPKANDVTEEIENLEESDVSDSFFYQPRTLTSVIKKPNYCYQSKNPAKYYRQKIGDMFRLTEKYNCTEEDFYVMGYIICGWNNMAREYLSAGHQRLAYDILDNLLWECIWGFLLGNANEQWREHSEVAKDIKRHLENSAKMFVKAINKDNKRQQQAARGNIAKLIDAQKKHNLMVCDLSCSLELLTKLEAALPEPSSQLVPSPHLKTISQSAPKPAVDSHANAKAAYAKWKRTWRQPDDSPFYYHSSLEKVLFSCAVFTILSRDSERELNYLKAIHLLRQYSAELIEAWQSDDGDFDYLFKAIDAVSNSMPGILMSESKKKMQLRRKLTRLMAIYTVGLGMTGDQLQSKAEELLADVTVLPRTDTTRQLIASPKIEAFIQSLQPILDREERIFG